jgi:hypothetical protein
MGDPDNEVRQISTPSTAHPAAIPITRSPPCPSVDPGLVGGRTWSYPLDERHPEGSWVGPTTCPFVTMDAALIYLPASRVRR